MIKRVMCAALVLLMGLSIFVMVPMQATAVDMHVSSACVELIKQMEGFTAVPVWDYSQWTVGFGTSCPSEHRERYQKDGIPVEEAEALLAEKLVYFDEKVNNFIKKNNLTLTQGQYDAIFSLTYNCGASWLSKSEGALYQAIVTGATGNEFVAAYSAWCTANGKFLSGLMDRRLAEAEMYLYGRYQQAVPDYYCYVKYDANGGNRSAVAQGYDTRYEARPMATATYSGYIFLGWYTDPKGGSLVTSLDESHHGTTLYAHWQEDDSAGESIKPVTVTVTADVLNVRAGAGIGYSVVAQVTTGMQLDITAVKTVNNALWGFCSQGWVALEYTNYDLVSGSVNSGPNSGEKIYATITASAVNVRKGPGPTYGTVKALHRGDVVQIFEQTAVDGRIWGRCEAGWFRITGYARLETVTEEEEEGQQPDDGQPDSGTVIPPVTPEPDVDLPDAPIHATILGSEPMAVRKGPHKTYPSCGEYAVNTRVEILEFTYFLDAIWGRTDKGWIQVDHYVMLDEGDNLVNTFTITVRTSSLYVRKGPGAQYGSVKTVKSGTKLEILALKEVDGGTWGRIYCGWINLRYTDYTPSMVPDQTVPDNCETLGHSYTDTVVAPTCDAAGYTTHVCQRCGHSYTDTEVAATGHSYVDSVVAPGCETAGYTSHTCSKCNHSYTDTEVAATGHNYVDSVVAPTCVAAGYTAHTCDRCGHSYKDTEVAATAHSYVSVVTPPTTKEQGFTTHTCQMCGHSYVDSYTDPVKNTVTVTVTKVFATVTGGSVNVRKGPGASYGVATVIRRGAVVEILEQKEVDGKIWGRYENGWFRITGYATLETITETYEVEVETPDDQQCQHSYVDTVKAPTCTEPGYTIHTCEKCGYSYKDTEVAAKGHNYTSVVTAPTTQDKGYTTHTCTGCGHSYVDSYTDPVKDTVTETVTKIYATITGGSVNVRKGPGASYGAVTVIRRGAVVEILEQKEVDGKVWGRYENGWFRITGYATVKTVTTQVEVPKPSEPTEPENPPVEPEQPTEPENPPVEPEQPDVPEIPEIETTTKIYATITGGSVNVRKGPGASYGAVTVIRRGTVVEILEQKEVDGKIWGRYENGWFRITGYATVETKEESNTTMTVNTDRLNVRKGAGLGYAVIDSLNFGTKVTIFEIVAADGMNWARTEYGWVSMDYLK